MTAIIPAAGKGTRFLPVTRVVPKEMLPIGAKPAIHCIVDEAIEAGADDIVIIISKEKEIIRHYFEGDPAFVGRVRFVYQKEQRGLGHAVLQAMHPCSTTSECQNAVTTKEDSGDCVEGVSGTVLILLGDALVTGPNPSREMVAVSRANGGASVVGLERVPQEKVSRYGIVAVEGGTSLDAGGSARIADLVEKPKVEEAPSDLAIAGRYLLDGDIFGLLATQTPGYGGEIQLTDAIRRLLATKPVYGYVYPGKRQDIGNPQGYFKALEAFNDRSGKG